MAGKSKVRGIKELKDAFAAMGLTSDQRIQVGMAGGAAMEGEIKVAIRDMGVIDTGNLLNSISHELGAIDKNVVIVYIGTNVEYAPYPELGWSRGGTKIAARPYMRQPFDERQDAIVSLMERTLYRLKEIGRP